MSLSSSTARRKQFYLLDEPHHAIGGSRNPAAVETSPTAKMELGVLTRATPIVQKLEGTWDQVSKIFSGAEITTLQTNRSAAPNRGASIALGGARLWWTSRQASTLTCARIPADYVVFLIPLNGICQHVVNAQKLPPNSIVLCEPKSSYLSRNAPGKKSCVIALPAERALQCFRALSGGAPRFAGQCRVLKLPSKALRALEQTVGTVAGRARKKPHVFESDSARCAMERSLLVAVVRASLSAEVVSAGHTRLSASVTSICERANAYLQEHQAEPVYVANICSALGISERTLNSAFARGFGIAPIAYLRLQRLHQAREQLKRGCRLSASVKAIAFEAGFSDLGRFATYYRQAFGESPHETLDRTESGS